MKTLAWAVVILVACAPVPARGEDDNVALEVKGYIVAAHPVQIAPAVGGLLTWLDPKLQEGAIYKKGDKLAVIDPRIYEARVQAARGALQAAEVNLQEVDTGSALQQIQAEKALLRNRVARLDLARLDERNKRAAGSGLAREELEKATLMVAAEQAAVEQQKQVVDKLETSLKERRIGMRAILQETQASFQEAETNLRYCTIVSPIAGTILSKKVEIGTYVNPLAFQTPAWLADMADLKDLEVEIDLPERDTGRVKPGLRCRIFPDAGQNDAAFRKAHPDGYAGVVVRRMPTANRAKGAVTWRIKVEIPDSEQPGEFLIPDMGALVSVRPM